MSDTASESGREEGPTLGVYEGERNSNGQRHGRGKNTFPNGDIFEGCYVNGKRQGAGVYRWKTGARYMGDYMNNLRHGQGTMYYPDGSKYKGDFVEGKRHGNGVFVYANGDVYNGGWENDLKHGKGTYTYAATDSKKSGKWEQGALVGAGEIVHADHKIVGNFQGNSRMAVPVKLVFSHLGYTQETKDAKFFGNAAPAESEEVQA